MAENPYVNMALSCADKTAVRLALIPNAQRIPLPTLEIFSIDEFLDAEMCDWLIKLIDENALPSKIVDSNGDAKLRTSYSCDLSHEDSVVRALNAYLHEAAGIAQMFGEPIQGQRYYAGQQFKPHADFFNPNGESFHENCAIFGQRTWTMMIYLNVPEAGGATRFTNVKKSFRPATGKLLGWNNITPDGLPNMASMHQGMPVQKGRKYIITKWFRERPFAWTDEYLTDLQPAYA
jgi:prolyl 4-hydroxylase